MSRLSQRLKLRLGFAAALAVLAAIAVVSLWSTSQLIATERWVSHTHAVVRMLQEVLTEVDEVETSQRGYLLTGRTVFLEPYEAARGRLPARLRDLRRLTAHNPRRQRAIVMLSDRVARRLRLAESLVAVQRRGRFTAASFADHLEDGRRAMNAVRESVQSIRAEEERLLELRLREAERVAAVTRGVIGGGFALAVGVVLFAIFVIDRDMVRREQEERALRAAEERLRLLYEATSRESLSLDERLHRLLEFGCEHFGLPMGLLGRITEGRYEVTAVFSPDGSVPIGFTCPASETLCREVSERDQPLAVRQLSRSEWRRHPAPSRFGIETYLGAPVRVGEELYGVVCFVDEKPLSRPLTVLDREYLRLMAQWLGSELARSQAEERLASANASLAALAERDPLTGLYNRRAFDTRIQEEIARARRHGTPLSVLLLDVDRFKQYNDAYGHPAGDAVLRVVAEVLRDAMRASDLPARFGGEEFIILLPHTGRNGAAALGERVRAAVAAYPWNERAVTVSVGVATLAGPDAADADTLVAAADEALYASKRAGRNRVTQAGSTAPPAMLTAAA